MVRSIERIRSATPLRPSLRRDRASQSSKRTSAIAPRMCSPRVSGSVIATPPSASTPRSKSQPSSVLVKASCQSVSRLVLPLLSMRSPPRKSLISPAIRNASSCALVKGSGRLTARPSRSLAMRMVSADGESRSARGNKISAWYVVAPSRRPSSGKPSSSIRPVSVAIPDTLAITRNCGMSAGARCNSIDTGWPRNCPPSDSLLIVSRSMITAPVSSVIAGAKPVNCIEPPLVNSRVLKLKLLESLSGTFSSMLSETSPETVVRSSWPPKISAIGLLIANSRIDSRVPLENAVICNTGLRRSAISTLASITSLP